MNETIEQFRRYAEMIGSFISQAGETLVEAESATAVQVERGAIFARAILDPRLSEHDFGLVERLIELTTTPRVAELAIVDASGHHRPVYRALLVYAWLQAFRLAYETLPQAQFGRW